MRVLPSGSTLFTFSIAENNRDKVSFYDVEYFAKADTIVKFMSECLLKGAPVFVSGRLEQDRWESTDGTKHSKIKLIANDVQVLPRASESTKESGNTGELPEKTEQNIPF